MLRRDFLLAGVGATFSANVLAQDKWGASQGYPIGVPIESEPSHRVGNYSGGLEKLYPHSVITASAKPTNFNEAYVKNLKYRDGLFSHTPDHYLDNWPVTGLLICRGSDILLEQHRFDRTAEMRMTGWSMSKSVTSLLLGICLDRKLIASYDDPAEKYVPALAGTLHGSITLRNLGNMSSGADVDLARDDDAIFQQCLMGPDTNIFRTVAGWNRRREDQGQHFNYNELCALTVGLVIRGVSGMSLSEFAQQALWQPMGAEADATWLTDSHKVEFNCIGYAARLRDWARLGNLVAHRGRSGNTQVVSEAWIDECTHWGERDQQVRVGYATRWGAGYKAFMWHIKSDGSMPYFNGHHGQYVMIHMPTKTVLVQTCVEDFGKPVWQTELFSIFEAATNL